MMLRGKSVRRLQGMKRMNCTYVADSTDLRIRSNDLAHSARLCSRGEEQGTARRMEQSSTSRRCSEAGGYDSSYLENSWNRDTLLIEAWNINEAKNTNSFLAG